MIREITHQEPPYRPPASRPLVCVVDSEAETRQFLCKLFRSAHLPTLAFSSATAFLNKDGHDGPCCLFTEVSMHEIDGLALQQMLSGRSEQVVFLSGRADVPTCARAMKAGAVDFLTKPASAEVILDATTRALARSEAFLSARATRASAETAIASLTPRERAVMHRVIAGMLNKQIASELGIAEKTIKVHRGRVMHKTGMVSVADLVRLCLLAGISDAGVPAA